MTDTIYGPPQPREYFTKAMTLAGLTRVSLNDTHALRTEVREALKVFEEKNTWLAAKTEEIQKSYAPEAVKNAVDAASAVLVRFDGESKDVIVELGRRADRVSSGLLMRTAFWAVITSVCLAFAGWVVVKYVPSLTEIADRRGELQGLQNQIEASNRRVEALKDSLIKGTDGRWYLRYAPTSTFCPDPKRPEVCAPYVPFP